MFPLILDMQSAAVAVVGNSEAAARRVNLLDAAGTGQLSVFAPEPGPEIIKVSGPRLKRRFPTDAEIAKLTVLFTADLPDPVADDLARVARDAKTLVNTEDVKPLCDFHVPSMVRRGDLLLAISTNGKSPGLARRLRRTFEAQFGPGWADHLEEIAAARAKWRAEGLDLPTLAKRTDALIDEKGWLA